MGGDRRGGRERDRERETDRQTETEENADRRGEREREGREEEGAEKENSYLPSKMLCYKDCRLASVKTVWQLVLAVLTTDE